MLQACAAVLMTILVMRLWQHWCPERSRENKAAISRWAQLVDRRSVQHRAIQEPAWRHSLDATIRRRIAREDAEKAANANKEAKRRSTPKAECRPKARAAPQTRERVDLPSPVKPTAPTQPEAEPPPPGKTRHLPECPKCQAAMTLKNARRGGQFWGCSTWPKCTGSMRPAEGFAAVRAAAAELIQAHHVATEELLRATAAEAG